MAKKIILVKQSDTSLPGKKICNQTPLVGGGIHGPKPEIDIIESVLKL